MTARWIKRFAALLVPVAMMTYGMQCSFIPESSDTGSTISGVCAPDTPDCEDMIVVQ